MNTMQHYVIERMGQPDVEFEGRLLARVDSKLTLKAQETQRWTELAVYATTEQHFVLVSSGKSARKGEHDLNKVFIGDTLEDLIPVLGMTWLAKDLLKKLGIEVRQKI